MLKHLESVIFFVSDINAAAAWYAEIFRAQVQHENPHYAFVRTSSLLLGFHPVDGKCSGGIGGTTVYWEVDDLAATMEFLQARGAKLHRGPITTDFGARAVMLIDPFGCTLGLNQSTWESRHAIAATDSGAHT